ncbi:5b64e6bc-b63a-4d10-959c-87c9debdf504 [Thermothielavioides terrestris]|uniref:5b64e6bc-b63a-4d10-959c-87c9debdf504 n=1 Tax=Thermothielavioides terrestris TaxID=2587410 RepID=A0A446B5A4_9PEZI|nr:5b64e6bc-b63a-4d10-959c-87c9debdf504 [Thermothielavioides terrestris]
MKTRCSLRDNSFIPVTWWITFPVSLMRKSLLEREPRGTSSPIWSYMSTKSERETEKGQRLCFPSHTHVAFQSRPFS